MNKQIIFCMKGIFFSDIDHHVYFHFLKVESKFYLRSFIFVPSNLGVETTKVIERIKIK